MYGVYLIAYLFVSTCILLYLYIGHPSCITFPSCVSHIYLYFARSCQRHIVLSVSCVSICIYFVTSMYIYTVVHIYIYIICFSSALLLVQAPNLSLVALLDDSCWRHARRDASICGSEVTASSRDYTRGDAGLYGASRGITFGASGSLARTWYQVDIGRRIRAA